MCQARRAQLGSENKYSLICVESRRIFVSTEISAHIRKPSINKFIYFYQYNGTRPLSRCYLRCYLVKNTAEAHKEPSKKYKNNLRTLKSKSYEQCRTKHKYYNNKAPHFLTAGLQIFLI